MVGVDQTIFTKPHGNCMQACVASIFELPLETVPNFVEHDNWWDYLTKFCLTHGTYPVCTSGAEYAFHGYHMIGVMIGEDKHYVIGKAGKIAYDPYPGKNTLSGVKYEILDYILFVATDPALHKLLHASQQRHLGKLT